jgi:hypothetical protein
MYAAHAVDEAALRRLEAACTHRLEQLDAKWDARLREVKYSLDALKSSLEWRIQSLESDAGMWTLMPWLLVIPALIILTLLGVDR